MDSIKKDLQEASDANSDFEITQKKGPRSLAENLHVKKTKQFAENNATQIMGDNITLRTKKDDQNHSSKTDDYFPLRDDISCQFITMIPSLPIKPPLRPDFAARNDENEFPALVDNEEEEIHPLDGQGKIRCNRKGNIEFSVVELEFMEEDYKTILQDPDLEEEGNIHFMLRWFEMTQQGV
ncbi:hypothetical protein GLOIN_2v1477228 [Rhizophagus irregularis DAOM 181602=DAOM 197198]|uniref:Uncharacterized protein n=1 Tax=Rhizophagus irregularis (strain DAOM 181602 / DAOM 197198 / MUCL 43194) TaxID=747089 RepID=A0A2P4Q5Y9_RHIID|nr:hypothetical protein GLOIN_2v1477228 [Rhizophagus irregularis DAOM 181602=DAOM 197198]POG73047.1 hypothetical protein GLOIN_2v1477228 [Rhizophagus irregularis DAOM 181602=DAOM 197198]|eukprot:XP_025179913.1 hypothetical protein GLOIN_2v1477228 [Rhizophagus irregularis DAOM 181602=DAOM 197198]